MPKVTITREAHNALQATLGAFESFESPEAENPDGSVVIEIDDEVAERLRALWPAEDDWSGAILRACQGPPM